MREYQKKWMDGQAVLYKTFRSYVPVTYEVKAIVNRIEQRGLQRIEALDIGAGEGSVALQIINSLQGLGVKVLQWDAVDVSKEQLGQFQAQTTDILKPKFRFYLQGWNELNPKRQYDFVLARHSWYGVSKWREEPKATNALTKLHRAIKKGGLGLIVLSPKDNVLFAMPNPFQGDTTSKDVCKALKRIGIKFSCQRVERPLPVLLEKDELTEAAQGIFRYMLHTEDISEMTQQLKVCLAEWFSRHKKWVSESDLIWIEK